MARQYVDDNADMFRVVVTEHPTYTNPEYHWRSNPSVPAHLIDESRTLTKFYGPYKTKGAATAQCSLHKQDGYGNPWAHVIGAHVEKANTVWEVVL